MNEFEKFGGLREVWKMNGLRCNDFGGLFWGEFVSNCHDGELGKLLIII